MGEAVAVVRERLRGLGNPALAERAPRFFKTGPGEYGEGDAFLGIRVPELRRLAREHRGLPTTAAFALLDSPYHEERLLALILLGARMREAAPREQKRIYERYVARIARRVNNWDLVDASAREIAGAYLETRSREPLYRLARSANLWERRVAIIATFRFIKKGELADTLAIAELLLDDAEDLIHKAVGWMLREVGNRDREAEERFLRRHRRRMPRTMLRYAIEKFPEPLRRAYLSGAALPASSAPGEVSGSA